jgi:hypothetical protein
VDFFFSLAPLDVPGRIEKMFALASKFTIEVETHPVSPEEYKFLAGGEIFRLAEGYRIAPQFAVPGPGAPGKVDKEADKWGV